MTIYEHRTSQTASSGSVSSYTLNVPGGLLKQVLIRARTDTTVFRFNLTDNKGIVRLNYGFHSCEINDVNVEFPIVGVYSANITNASPNDTFDIILAVQEN